MKDPTERYKEIVDEAEQQAEGIFGRAEALFPTHSREATIASPEEERRDYQMAKGVPDGLRMRLREKRQQFGLRRAAFDFIKWDKRNRD